jgi:hypothetical protein
MAPRALPRRCLRCRMHAVGTREAPAPRPPRLRFLRLPALHRRLPQGPVLGRDLEDERGGAAPLPAAQGPADRRAVAAGPLREPRREIRAVSEARAAKGARPRREAAPRRRPADPVEFGRRSHRTLQPSVRRIFLAFLLSFLLLSLQREVAVHALGHLGNRHEQGATTPQQGQPCAECELLASGADSIPASAVAPVADCESTLVAQVAFTTRTVAAPACYSPRAPPVLL